MCPVFVGAGKVILCVMDELSRIDALNRRFGIAGVAQVVAGNGGLPVIRVTTPGASAEIYLHGAQVTAWRPAGGDEVIFVSGRSHWEDGRAIRGGIPICFPWFRAKADDAKAPAHGFVRTREWRLDSITAQEGIAGTGTAEVNGSVCVVCSTESDELTRRWWPHEFRMVYRVTMGDALGLELTVKNAGAAPFRFEEALHTYFSVGDAQSVRVRGLDQVKYLDNTDGNREKTQQGDVVFAAPTDNAYLNTDAALELIDPVLKRAIRTEKENSATTVVWNPWRQGAAALSDLGEDEWERMTCVEASNILACAVELAPGEEHTLRATIRVSRAGA
jgi:glucose-6-phosphate 1-epimerase